MLKHGRAVLVHTWRVAPSWGDRLGVSWWGSHQVGPWGYLRSRGVLCHRRIYPWEEQMHCSSCGMQMCILISSKNWWFSLWMEGESFLLPDMDLSTVLFLKNPSAAADIAAVRTRQLNLTLYFKPLVHYCWLVLQVQEEKRSRRRTLRSI